MSAPTMPNRHMGSCDESAPGGAKSVKGCSISADCCSRWNPFMTNIEGERGREGGRKETEKRIDKYRYR